MEKYKVIKEFGCAKKGDVFEKNEEGYFEMDMISECTDMYSSRNMCISPSIVDTLVSDEHLAKIEESSEAEEKLKSISEYITELVEQYEKDHEDLIAEYNEGSLPACVKVEADTVYFNMNKVLTKIKDLLNE